MWSVLVDGQRAVGRLGSRADADLAWETELMSHIGGTPDRCRGRASARGTGQHVVGTRWLESAAEVEALGRWVVRFETDLDPFRSGRDEQVDAARQNVSGEAPLLMCIFGAHRLGDTDGGLRVVPEQPVRGDVVVVVVHDQIERGAIQRRLLEPKFGIAVVAFGIGHVMRPTGDVAAVAQPVPVWERTDHRSLLRCQPHLDQSASFVDRETTTDEKAAKDIVGRVDLKGH